MSYLHGAFGIFVGWKEGILNDVEYRTAELLYRDLAKSKSDWMRIMTFHVDVGNLGASKPVELLQFRNFLKRDIAHPVGLFVVMVYFT